MQTKIALQKLESEKELFDRSGKVVASFYVGHSNETTTLEQTLKLANEGAGWTAEMTMEGFPQHENAAGAANKLADWMERMAAAIREGEFENFNLNEL